MANHAEHVLGSKAAAKRDIATMPLATLGATVLYFLPEWLLSAGLAAVCGAFNEEIWESLTYAQLLTYIAIYLVANLLIVQPLYFGLTQFYALRRGGARPSVVTVTVCFVSIRVYLRSIRLALTIFLFTLLWCIPAFAICAAAYGLLQLVQGAVGLLLFYELVILAVILLICMVSRYHCAYALAIEKPELSCWQAVRSVAKTFRGHKRELYSLVVSFIPWFLLTVFVGGLLLVVVCPYYLLALFHLFDIVRGVQIRIGTDKKDES